MCRITCLPSTRRAPPSGTSSAPAPPSVAGTIPSAFQSSGMTGTFSNGFGAQHNVSAAVPNPSSRQESGTLSGAETLPPAVVQDGIMTYFKCFHGQPYSLLCQKSLIGAHQPLSPIVLDPMLALSIRCSTHPFWVDREKSKSWIQSLTGKSWNDLLHMYGEGHTGLHYLQGLCLLAQVDFAGKLMSDRHYQDLSIPLDIEHWTSTDRPSLRWTRSESSYSGRFGNSYCSISRVSLNR